MRKKKGPLHDVAGRRLGLDGSYSFRHSRLRPRPPVADKDVAYCMPKSGTVSR
jgi:hypothetical protein